MTTVKSYRKIVKSKYCDIDSLEEYIQNNRHDNDRVLLDAFYDITYNFLYNAEKANIIEEGIRTEQIPFYDKESEFQYIYADDEKILDAAMRIIVDPSRKPSQLLKSVPQFLEAIDTYEVLEEGNRAEFYLEDYD